MTREETAERIKVMQAYVDGKQIQYYEGLVWCDTSNPCWINDTEYRIKPDSKYRPFANAEECWQEMQKHQPFGWLKSKTDKNYSFILEVDEDSCHFVGDESWSFADLLETETFADGTPFGIKE